jgi:hypothetical protein
MVSIASYSFVFNTSSQVRRPPRDSATRNLPQLVESLLLLPIELPVELLPVNGIPTSAASSIRRSSRSIVRSAAPLHHRERIASRGEVAPPDGVPLEIEIAQ